MPRVLFLKDFDFKPNRQSTIVYKKGDVYLVRDDCAKKAIAAGAAELTQMPAPPSGLVETIRNQNIRKKRKPNGRKLIEEKPSAKEPDAETPEFIHSVSYGKRSDL